METVKTQSEDEQLDFEQSQHPEGEQQPVCEVCDGALFDTYYQVNGKATCQQCRYEVESSLTEGSGFGRFVRAMIFGVIGGILGAGVYYAVLALTGYEVGIIAILVGFLVGKGVSIGASMRGGWLYQLIAVLLTYVAIASTYVPMVLGEWEAMDGQPMPVAEETAGAGATGETVDMSQVPFVARLIGALILALMLPFLGGFANIMGLIIIGIGLWAAWNQNRKLILSIDGPFTVGDGAAEST